MAEEAQAHEQQEQAKKEKIRRVAREWYARNKNRIREAKQHQNNEYRRRVRIGRPRKGERKVMIFQPDTAELRQEEEEDPAAAPAVVSGQPPAPPKIESGNFFVSFE
jgi:hypothetical protein